MYNLSIVIAAYNEKDRLPATLERLFKFLETKNISYELILVNDGSSDTTLEIIDKYAKRYPYVKALTHSPNRGRGYAIRVGILAATGEIILETDADGSVSDEAIIRFLKYFSEHQDIDVVFGSRELYSSRIAKKQPIIRVILGYGFIYLAKIIFWAWETTDFTLGFKMFRQEAAMDIFTHQFDNYYVAEAEIVYVTKKRGWQGIELPVTWTDNKDSRVRPFRDSWRSIVGLCHLYIRISKSKYTK
jgi:dolichyl-phosphate beta-glucosyltransferase